MNPADQQTTQSLGQYMTENPLAAVALVVLIIGAIVAVGVIARNDWKHRDDDRDDQ